MINKKSRLKCRKCNINLDIVDYIKEGYHRIIIYKCPKCREITHIEFDIFGVETM